MVLNGVGAVKSIPKAMGKFVGMNELNLMGQGMNSPVSGWIAVETTVCALRILSISCLSTRISGDPVLIY